MTDSLFGNDIDRAARDDAIVSAYEHASRTLDDLPYTDEFETLIAKVRETDEAAQHREVFHRLHNLRKAGKLPRLGRAASSPFKLSYEDEQLLIGLVRDAAGSLGQRDQLPYTAEFDALAGTFTRETGLNLDRHALWRVIAKLAK
ncbi:MAG: hypothetical protein Phyf2KO_21310 [Phycisphaerales bacterium]